MQTFPAVAGPWSTSACAVFLALSQCNTLWWFSGAASHSARSCRLRHTLEAGQLRHVPQFGILRAALPVISRRALRGGGLGRTPWYIARRTLQKLSLDLDVNIGNAQISIASPTKQLQMQVKNSDKIGKRGELYS